MLKWKKGAMIVVSGILFMLLGLGVYQASKQLAAIPPPVRLIAFIAFLCAVFGYSANRAVRAIEYKPWFPRA